MAFCKKPNISLKISDFYSTQICNLFIIYSLSLGPVLLPEAGQSGSFISNADHNLADVKSHPNDEADFKVCRIKQKSSSIKLCPITSAEGFVCLRTFTTQSYFVNSPD